MPLTNDQLIQKVKHLSHLDNNQQLYFARELEHIKSKLYEIKYPTLKARTLFNLNFESDFGAKTITYRMYGQNGKSKIIANYAKDLPNIGLNATEVQKPVREIGNSFSWTEKDFASASMANLPLDSKLARASKRSSYELENEIVFLGDTNSGIVGLFNFPNVPQSAVLSDGIGASPLWADKTPDQIIRDVSACINGVRTNTNGVEEPNAVVLPLSAYTALQNVRVTDTGSTVLTYLEKAFPNITMWEWLNELETAGTGNTRMMFAYTKSPDHVEIDVPLEFKLGNVQYDGWEYKVPTLMSTGGISIYYPLSFNMLYGF